MTTDQKIKVQQMRMAGHSYMQIASALQISENTIKSYCRRNNLTTCKNSPIANSLPTEDKELHIACKQCGKPLKPEKRGQPKKFCSEECRRKWWKSNDSQIDKKAWYTLTCAGCGNEFESYGNKDRKFCGHACYISKRFKKVGDTNES